MIHSASRFCSDIKHTLTVTFVTLLGTLVISFGAWNVNTLVFSSQLVLVFESQILLKVNS